MEQEDWRIYAWLGSVGIMVVGFVVLELGGVRIPLLALSGVVLFAGVYSAFIVGRS